MSHGETPDRLEQIAEKLREPLAALAHEQWTGWMEYLFGKCALTPQGDAVIPKSSVLRWRRQMGTTYADLSEPEKDSDRKEAERVLEIVLAALREAAQPQWQPMETAPKDGTPFLVTWAPSRMGYRKPCVEMVGGWDEYEECRSYGEPEAYGWHPLPRTLLSPLSALPAAPSSETKE